MRKIRIFISSSIVEFEKERKNLGDFVRSLNDIYINRGIYFKLILCEDLSKSISIHRKQDEYNNAIKNCQYFYIIFGSNAGEYSIEEFNIALSSFKKTGSPKIYTYFHTLPNNTSYPEAINAFMNRLENELGHYYSMFSHIDSIKLNILLELTRDPELGGGLEIKDGIALLDGNKMINVSNMPVYYQNESLSKLISEKSDADENYKALCDMKSVMGDNLALNRMITENEEKRYSIQKQIYTIEDEILELCKKTATMRSISGNRLNWREKKAIEYVDMGNYKGAKQVLEDPIWELEVERSILQVKCATQAIDEYINGQRMLIKTMSAMGIDESTHKKIIKCYEKIVNLCIDYRLQYDTLLEYALFLMTHNNHAKAISVLQKLILIYTVDNNDKQCIAEAKYYLACLMYKVNNTTDAEKFHLEAIEIREKMPKSNCNNLKLAWIYNQLAYLYFRIKR